MRPSALLVVVLAALPASARQELLPLVSPGYLAAREGAPSAFGAGAGYASYDGTGHALSGPVFAWTLRHGPRNGWGFSLGSDAALLSGTSESGQPTGRVPTHLGGASLRGMVCRAFPLGSGTGTAALGLAFPFTIASYETSFDVLAGGKRSSLTPDTAVALSVGVPVAIVVDYPLGSSWSVRPHVLAAFWPGAGIFYAYKFLGPFTPRRSEGVRAFGTFEGGLALFHRSGLGLTSRLQWTTAAGSTAATRGVSAGLAYEFGFGKP